eukprot:TRINITY_DN1132_c2_g1_i1.p2 TRINITY_DN1132_c2_g1~~TRINITY_DN1132_c2_g1_i1.p2  ORF type:complete len:336 (-),score=114.26 TRINITY_DN1132_c2_g1_i1:209-1216(-)
MMIEGFPPSPGKCDVFSFAIIAWYLLSEEPPFSDEKDPLALKKMLISGTRPPASSTNNNSSSSNSNNKIPKSLMCLLEQCWDGKPESRPTFQTVIISSEWDAMMAEAIHGGETAALEMWKNFNPTSHIEDIVVPWNTFITQFMSFVGSQKLQESSTEHKCLMSILDVDNNNKNVTFAAFKRILDWFGPIRTGKSEGSAFLSSIVKLLESPWFHGPITKEEAYNRIRVEYDSSNKKGGFLVRFSEKKRTYTISHHEKKSTSSSSSKDEPFSIQNLRVDPNNLKNIINFVEKTVIKQWKLVPVSRNRKYNHIFQKDFDVHGSYSATDDYKSSSSSRI